MARKVRTLDVLDVLEALWELTHAIEARSKWMRRHLGVTGPQRLLLRIVGEDPGCAPGEAARRLRLDPATVSRLAAGLERSGCLKRELDGADGRRQHLLLTRRGRALSSHRHGTIEEAVHKVLVDHPRIRPARKARFLRRLAATLAVDHEEARAPRRRR